MATTLDIEKKADRYALMVGIPVLAGSLAGVAIFEHVKHTVYPGLMNVVPIATTLAAVSAAYRYKVRKLLRK
jgi:hypothetical protein